MPPKKPIHFFVQVTLDFVIDIMSYRILKPAVKQTKKLGLLQGTSRQITADGPGSLTISNLGIQTWLEGRLVHPSTVT